MDAIPMDLFTDWKIMIVDDEEDSLEVARFILDFYGAIVITATDGREALDVIKQQRPNFVISDLSMPGMDGWELLHNLKVNPLTADLPIFALTAHAMVGDRERALAAGLDNYLTKPLSADTFMQQLVAMLASVPVLKAALQI